MDNYQTMLKLCMIGTPIFTILTALCGFGWNYYGLKIKETDALKAQQKQSPNTSTAVKNVYNIGGDMVYGDKKTIINKQEEKAPIVKHEPFKPNLSETVLDIGNTNLGPNPYFTYDNNLMDFVVAVYAVGNSIGHFKSKTLTLVRCDTSGNPIDSKAFKATDFSEEDLIYKEKPFVFSQKMGNLTSQLFDSLFVVIDIKYTNESMTFEKELRKIYSVKLEYAKQKIPQATAEQYSRIAKFLDSKNKS
jgi:hypothetical protein